MIDRVTSNQFQLVSKYEPAGDQPEAISQLVAGVNEGKKRKFY